MLFYVVTLLSFLIPISLQDSYFCDLKCNDEEHTVCKYEVRNINILLKTFSITTKYKIWQPCLPHDNCGDKYKMLQLDDEERTYITTIHNDFRQRVASGEDKRGGNNKAANMRAFVMPQFYYRSELTIQTFFLVIQQRSGVCSTMLGKQVQSERSSR